MYHTRRLHLFGASLVMAGYQNQSTVKEKSTCWPEVIEIHPSGTEIVCAKFYSNLSNSLWTFHSNPELSTSWCCQRKGQGSPESAGFILTYQDSGYNTGILSSKSGENISFLNQNSGLDFLYGAFHGTPSVLHKLFIFIGNHIQWWWARLGWLTEAWLPVRPTPDIHTHYNSTTALLIKLLTHRKPLIKLCYFTVRLQPTSIFITNTPHMLFPWQLN